MRHYLASLPPLPSAPRLQLKQLGTAYFVFPGAAHNRFEHSIGVSHVSGQLIDFLAVQQPELEITGACCCGLRVDLA